LTHLKALIPPPADTSVMSTTTNPTMARHRAGSWWIDVLRPREHGSWSLALEPIALGLLAAPSAAGAALALATLAGFLGRRPLQLLRREEPGPRRATAAAALALLSVLAATMFVAAVANAGTGWLVWLVPGATAGAGFLAFDWRNAGRDEWAEVLGAVAFASVAAAIAAAAGAPQTTVGGLLFVSLARALPTVVLVRALVRGAKTNVRRPVLPLLVEAAAVAGAIVLAWADVIPLVPVLALSALGVRAVALLRPGRPTPRARTLGLQELALGAAYVLVVGLTWPGWIHAKP
jgi:hypothetical protein